MVPIQVIVQAVDIFNETGFVGGVANVSKVDLNDTWLSGIFDDGSPIPTAQGTEETYMFGVDVIANQTNFQGAKSDYQMMVPVTQSGNDPGVAIYYFFMDLG